jgi:transcriptional regulator with XRE-family HTH domain
LYPQEDLPVETTDLGRRAREWRIEKRMLLSDMARLLGIGSTDLRGCELGRRPWPDDVQRRLEEIIAF